MAEFIGVKELPIRSIDVSRRLRPVNETAVVSLMASLMEIGQKDEIHVRRVRHQGNRLVLLAGAHRVEAHVRLGCTSISAKVWECNNDWAELIEIDDNLAHAELNPLDLSVFLARRKVVYERMHPEAKNGGLRGNQHTGGRQNDIMSFCQSTAEQRALSTRQIERLVAAGSALDEEAIALLRKAPVRVTLSDLQTLGKCGDAAHRRSVCEILSRGEAKNAKAALEGLRAGPVKAVLSKTDEHAAKIRDAWNRAGMGARRRFVVEHESILRALLAGLDAEEANES
tara:strand:- start:59 stop:910 length:852 start_codon:yes stop_codon:yes gene_type:complete